MLARLLLLLLLLLLVLPLLRLLLHITRSLLWWPQIPKNPKSRLNAVSPSFIYVSPR
jgi:hypothetical protein